MKVLLIKSYPVLTSVGLLANGLKQRNHDVHVLVPWEHADCDTARSAGIPVHVLDFTGTSRCRSDRSRITFSGLARTVRFIKRHHFDIVHCNLIFGRLLGRLTSVFAGDAVVLSTIRGMEARHEKWTNWLDRRTVAVSSTVKAFLIDHGVPARKIVVIPNGVDLTAMDAIEQNRHYLHDELGIDRKVRLFGMVAYFRAHPMKGQKVFVDAARLVKQSFPEAQFVFVGGDLAKTGYNRAYFERYAQEVGLNGGIHFLGERWDIPAIMSSLYANVLPSMAEGCPMVILEAMARGTPNVASRIDSIAEILTHNKSGVLFEPGDSHQLGEAMVALLGDADLAARIGHAGRRKLEEKFTSGHMVDKYETLFECLI